MLEAPVRLTITTTDGDLVEVKDFDQESALDLVEALQDPVGHPFLTFDLDLGTTYVARRHIVRVDIDS